MGSLFTKIFVAFWLTAVLLGSAMFALEQAWGGHEVERAERWLKTHAETAGALLREEGNRSAERWLAAIGREERHRLFLVDGEGRPLVAQRMPPPMEHWISKTPLRPGAHYLRRGHFIIAAPVPESSPPAFLITVADVGRLHGLPPWIRILMALAISGLVSFGLAALLTGPVRRLRGAAQALADGDLSVRVGSRGRDEVAALSRDFDVMAERLREMLESQRRLLRDVSHELRSPLARLRVALELAEKARDPSQALGRIEKEAEQLERLIADLLSLARLESGQSILERKETALEAVVNAVVHDADFEAQAINRHVTLKVDDAAVVRGDPVLLRAAVENVVRNAVRHTAEGTEVRVTLAVEERSAVVTVCDQGPGVPEDELPRMFEPFTRVGEARDRGTGGYGLGLAISGQVLAAHGGDIRAVNRPEGGLCVTMRLPIATAKANA